MLDDLEITVARSNGSIDLVIGGDIDLATLDRFDRALNDAVHEANLAVNVDLSEVTFIDSVGVNALLWARKLAGEERVTLRIVKASAKVERALVLMDLADYFF